jgi:UDP-glucose:(heptosyl)LPS alpha-1,3-glucosyltransferase
MRLAFTYRRLAREGGTEADLYRTVAELAARRHEVHVFCGEIRCAPPRGVHVHRVRTVHAGRVARLLSFAWLAPRAVARSGRWDVVAGFGRTVRQDLVRCGGGTHRAYLETMRRSGARRRGLGLYHRAILALEAAQYRPGNFRRALAVSSRVRDEIVLGYGVAGDRVRVVYNGVDLARFHPRARAEIGPAVRQHLGLPAGEPVVLSVGSGFRRKGVDTLLRLWSDGPPADAHLVIVGGDERLGAYQRAAGAPALRHRVHVVGPQSAVEDFYAAADAVVVASLQEAFGNVVLESLAAGLPVVTSSRVGAAELLTGSLQDLVVDDPLDGAALRARLELALGPRGDELAAAARSLAERRPWAAHVADLEALLEETARAARFGGAP